MLALVPLTLILAVKAAQLGTQVLVNIYGIGVLTSTIVIMYIAFSNYRDPSLDATALTARPLVSCLVAVRDDVDLIERCLRSLLAQSYGNVEVIVVDDLSSDGTRELLTRLALELPIHVLLLEENVGKKRALTQAARRTRTGDLPRLHRLRLRPRSGARSSDACSRFKSIPTLGALSGHARALNADHNVLTRMQDVWYDGQFGVAKAAESVFASVTCVSGPLAAFRREAIYDYLPAWADDRFLGAEFRFATDRQLTGYVLRQRRWGIAYVHSARAWTQVPDTFTKMVRQQVRWKKSFVRNLFFTGSFYWRRGRLPDRDLLQPRRLGCPGARPRLPAPDLAAAARPLVPGRALPRRRDLQGRGVGDRLPDAEPRRLPLDLPAADEPDVGRRAVVAAGLFDRHPAQEHLGRADEPPTAREPARSSLVVRRDRRDLPRAGHPRPDLR